MEKLSRMLGEFLSDDTYGLRPRSRDAMVKAATGDPRIEEWDIDDHDIFFWIAKGFRYIDGGDRLSGFSATSLEEFQRKVAEVTREEVSP